eukprot:958280-Amphidinium_carterae.1
MQLRLFTRHWRQAPKPGPSARLPPVVQAALLCRCVPSFIGGHSFECKASLVRVAHDSAAAVGGERMPFLCSSP